MSRTVWTDGEIAISTYCGPVSLARGPRTRVQITALTVKDGRDIITLDLKQWASLCQAVRDLGGNPHYAPESETAVAAILP